MNIGYSVPPNPYYYEIPHLKKQSPRYTGMHPLPKGYAATDNTKLSDKAPKFTMGTLKILVILFEFQDIKHNNNHDFNYFDTWIFSTNSSDLSLTNYYKEVSYNQLNITGTIVPNWYTSREKMKYWGEDNNVSFPYGIDNLNDNITNLVREIVQQVIDSTSIDFSDYDSDNDGWVDSIMLIHAGYGQESPPDNQNIYIWSHKSNLESPYLIAKDGTKISSYAIFGEYSPLGVMCHEFGHALGMVDIYKTNVSSNNSVIHDFGLMDYGVWLPKTNPGAEPAHMCSFTKKYLGWITPTVINNTDTAISTINPITTDKQNSLYKFPLTTTADPDKEYYLISYRKKVGYDKYLSEEGVLIYYIDETAFNKYYYDNIINNNPNDMSLYLIKNKNNLEYEYAFQPGDVFNDGVTKNNNPTNVQLSFSKTSANVFRIGLYSAAFTEAFDIKKHYNYPNPFSDKTTIVFVTNNILNDYYVVLYNISGQEIKKFDNKNEFDIITLTDNYVKYAVEWDGLNSMGNEVAPGLYLSYLYGEQNSMKVRKSIGKIIKNE